MSTPRTCFKNLICKLLTKCHKSACKKKRQNDVEEDKMIAEDIISA